MAKKITIDLEAGTASFISGVDKAGKSLKDLGEHAEKSEGFLGKLKHGMAEGAGIEAFHKGFEIVTEQVHKLKEAFEEVGQMGRDALRLGISAEQMSRFQHAANATHTDVGAMTAAMDKLNGAIGKANDAGDADKLGATFQKLGLNARELAQMNPDEAFERTAEALGRLEVQSDKTAAARALFGKSGTVLIPMMEHLNELMRESDNIGFTRTAGEIKNVEQAERILAARTDHLKGVFMNFASSDFSTGLIEQFADLANQTAKYADEIAGQFIGTSAQRAAPKLNEAFGKSLAESVKMQKELKELDQSDAEVGLEKQIEMHKKLLDSLKEQATIAGRLKTIGASGADFGAIHDDRAGAASREQFALNALMKQKQAIDDVANAENKANEEQLKDIDKAKDALAKMKLKLDTFGLTPAQKELFDLTNLAKGRKDIIEAGVAIQRMTDAMEADKKVTEEIKRIQDEIGKKKGTNNDVVDAFMAGVDPMKVAGLAAAKKELQDFEDQQKRVAEATKWIEKTESPMDKYTQQMKELNDLLAHGELNQKQFDAAAKKTKQELAKADREGLDKHADLVERRFDFRMPAKSGNDPQRELVDIAKKQAQNFDTFMPWFNQIWQSVTQQQPLVFDLTGVP